MVVMSIRALFGNNILETFEVCNRLTRMNCGVEEVNRNGYEL